MYIRKSIRTYKGKTYTNYLLVESVQTPDGPRQRTICSLGSLEPAPAEDWLALAHKLAGTVGEPPPGPHWFHRLVSCRQGGVGCVLAAVTRAAAPEAGCCGAPA